MSESSIQNIKDLRKVIIIVQARMGSTRLPGKILKKVLGKPLLSYQLERLRRVKLVDDIVIATTNNPDDQTIVDFCREEKIAVFKGSEEDVLNRYYQAAKLFKADIIVRITSDCPLIDPDIIGEVIAYFLNSESGYVSNTLERTYPRGMDVEVFSFEYLEKSAHLAHKDEEREHVTLFIYRNPDLFKLANVANSCNQSNYRLTVDTLEDLELISKVIENLYPVNSTFSMKDVLNLLNKHPEWIKINAHIQQKKLSE